MYFVKNITIRKKLILILSLFIIGIGFIAATFHYTNYLTGKIEKVDDHFDLINESVHLINIEVLEARRREKDFLLRNDIKYLKMHDEVISSLEADFKHLESLSLDDPGYSALVLDVHELVKIYNKKFNEVAQLKIINGLDHNSGLLGELRAAVHEIEKILSDNGNVALSNSMLMMRRYEKDFIARHQDKYIEKLHAEHKHFLEQLSSSDHQQSISITIISQAINSYARKFNALTENTKEIEKKTTIFRKDVLQIAPKLSQLVAQTNQLKIALLEGHKETTTYTHILFYGVLALISFIIILFTISLIKSVNHSTGKIISMLREIATGDGVLTQRLDIIVKDEMYDIAHWFNQIVDKLEETLATINTSSNQIIESSVKAQNAKDQTTKAIQTQVDEISHIATAIGSMSISIEGVAANAQTASDGANEAVQTAAVGSDVFNEVIKSMEKMAVNADQANDSVRLLDEHSRNIDSIVTMINDIADQTNLLALNAAIEAARAGEAGRGFAVVADEVRSLSLRTTESTREIKSTIEELQKGTNQAVDIMDRGREQAAKGMERAKQADKSLTEMANSITSIASLNNNMADSAAAQSVVANQVNDNINQINMATAELSQSASQTMSDSGDLSQTASMLRMLASQYTKTEVNEVEVADEFESEIELF